MPLRAALTPAIKPSSAPVIRSIRGSGFAAPGYQFLVWPSDGAAARWPSDNKKIQVTKP
jgi:hypothetical protein